jgi:hypothetical protein
LFLAILVDKPHDIHSEWLHGDVLHASVVCMVRVCVDVAGGGILVCVEARSATVSNAVGRRLESVVDSQG